jgi:hypothetical protein
VPECSFVGDDGHVSGSAQFPEASGAHLDVNSIRQLQRIGGAVGDELTKNGRTFEGGGNVFEADFRLALIWSHKQHDSAFPGHDHLRMIAESGDVGREDGHAAALAAASADNGDELFNPTERFIRAARPSA